MAAMGKRRRGRRRRHLGWKDLNDCKTSRWNHANMISYHAIPSNHTRNFLLFPPPPPIPPPYSSQIWNHRTFLQLNHLTVVLLFPSKACFHFTSICKLVFSSIDFNRECKVLKILLRCFYSRFLYQKHAFIEAITYQENQYWSKSQTSIENVKC